MTVSIKRKNGTQLSFESIWEIQANREAQEITLVGYDHIIHSKESVSEIEDISVKFETD